jgi:hypothetical protein
MKKSTNFFIISNFNKDPTNLLKYTDNYIIYDQSKDQEIVNLLKSKSEINIAFVNNTGHNISDYFNFFIDNYDNLPNVMILGKGNMIGRHLSEEYFNRVYDNKCFTFLFNDENPKDSPHTCYHLFEGAILEVNNSWYITHKSNEYFESYDSLLKFIYINPIISKWVLFSPGACYIITKEHVLRNSKNFYKNLLKIITYTYFPAEAYILERMLPVIFLGNYIQQDYMNQPDLFDQKLRDQKEKFSMLEKLNASYRNKIAAKLTRIANFISSEIRR